MSNCQFCGEEGAIRRVRWGLWEGLVPSFVVWACRACNRKISRGQIRHRAGR